VAIVRRQLPRTSLAPAAAAALGLWRWLLRVVLVALLEALAPRCHQVGRRAWCCRCLACGLAVRGGCAARASVPLLLI
jgi:hypothetical protein